MLRWIGIFAGTIFLLSQPAAGQQSREAITLKITQDATSYTLTVPVSRLVMTVPKGELQVQRGAASGAGNSPRYFYLATQSAPQLIISGWFESADGFKDIESFWRTETAEWKRRGIAAPRNVSFEHIGAWNAALYDMHGSDVTNTNSAPTVRAARRRSTIATARPQAGSRAARRSWRAHRGTRSYRPRVRASGRAHNVTSPLPHRSPTRRPSQFCRWTSRSAPLRRP
jgi:hypothetical protein